MPAPVIADMFRVVLTWLNVSGAYGVNVLHVSAPGMDETDVYTAMNNDWQNAQQQTMSDDSDMDAVSVQALDGVSAEVLFPSFGDSSGQTAGDAVLQAATLVSLRTPLLGARHRGRVYLPFTAEGALVNGALDGTARDTQQTAWEDYRTNLIANGLALAIVSYKFGTAAAVTSLSIPQYPATQRRRIQRLY